MMTITIDNNLQQLAILINKSLEYLEQNKINQDVIQDIQLIIEEVVTNIIKYAYCQEQKQSIMITLKIDRDRIISTFEDYGKSFNPLQQIEDHDQFLATKQDTIGGLGIFLVQELADYIKYIREDNKNILLVEKHY